MLTPIGNPQNLYLFGVSDMKLSDFLVIMLPFTIVAGAMLFLWTLAVCKKSGKLSVKTDITAENFDTYSTKDKTAFCPLPAYSCKAYSMADNDPLRICFLCHC